jgi:ubiquinone/menaquinone biosynthesis C-methylase UbiE
VSEADGSRFLPERSRVREEFDAEAGTYESGRMAPWYKAQGRMVLEALDDVEGPVVDIGCGTGWFLRRLARTHPGIHGIGLDLSGAMVERARELTEMEGVQGLRFRQGDWEDPDVVRQIQELLHRPAEVVTCISAFHYFHDPAGALGRMRELLAPGGRVLVMERAKDASFLTAAWGLLHQSVLRDGVRFYRSEELKRLMTQAGFVEVRTLREIRKRFWKGKIYTSLTLLSGKRGAHD